MVIEPVHCGSSSILKVRFFGSDCSRLDDDDEDHDDHHDDDDADDDDCQESDCSRLAAEQVRGEVGLLIEDRVNRST